MKPMTESQLIERDEQFDIQSHKTWTDEDYIAEEEFMHRLEAWDQGKDEPHAKAIEDHDPNDSLPWLSRQLKYHTDRVERLKEVDDLIRIRATGDRVELGPRHKWAEPLVDAFAYDLPGWACFVREIWNSLLKRSPESIELREGCLRLIEERLDAQIRREREALLVEKYEAICGPFKSSKDKQRYLKMFRDKCSADRKALISGVRMASPLRKLTASQLRTLCENFWRVVDRKIEEGDIPAPN